MKALLLIFFLAISSIICAQPDAVRRKHFNIKSELALNGYDPVSYFSGKPVEGSNTFQVKHKGVIYYFQSKQNAEKFKTNPGKYEPAYGGWCAYAMGETGEKVKVDPETFKIIDNRLYLFYNFWGNNTLEDWNISEAKLKAAADKNWQKLLE
jgi:YHS domain-containing protein